MLERPEALIEALVGLVSEAGGWIEPEAVRAALELAVVAAAPAGAQDLTPHEVLRIRLNKAVARAVPADRYRVPEVRRRLRAEVARLLEAHGVPRLAPRLG